MAEKEYIDREDALDELLYKMTGTGYQSRARSAIKCLPAADVVSREAFEQVKWERDAAMKQLEEHGIPFGGKADVVEVVRCKDCKSWGGVTFGYICREWSGMTFRNYTKPDHYCSRGERKEQNDV